MNGMLHDIDDLLAAIEGDAADAPSRDEATHRTRVEQLTAELDTLKASHAEALAAAIEEVTERRRAEEELRRLHQQYQLILNSAAEGVVGTDSHGRIIFANPPATRMLGWTAEELSGKLLHETVRRAAPSEGPHPASQCPSWKTLRTGETSHCSSEGFSRRDGTSFPVDFTTTAIRDGGEILGVVLTFRDISEQRMLEAQLRQAQKLESIGQLAAGIAHEINTPTQYIGDNLRFLEGAFSELQTLHAAYQGLREAAATGRELHSAVASVLAAAESADADYLLAEVPKAVRQSLEGVEHVARIVRSMKEFSHPGGDQMQAVDLNHALDCTLSVSRNEWKYVAEVVRDFDPGLPSVLCLPGEINQVLLNLVVNAAHAIAEKLGPNAKDKGTITIRTRRRGAGAPSGGGAAAGSVGEKSAPPAADCVEIRVEDTGAGIPEHIRGRVYDPFFTTKPVGRGTGQGLAIAHSIIVEKHGGQIAFETEVGRGTTFVVRLPVRPAVVVKGGPE
jgi:PAS domain S-box-containing protein